MPVHVLGALLVSALLIYASWSIRKQIAAGSDIVPDERVSVKNVLEMFVEMVVGLLREIIGHGGEKFLPLVGTVFIFILSCNLLGMIPGFSPPTVNISTNAAVAIIVFFGFNYYGFKEHGVGYLKQFLGPVIYIAVLFAPIEIISTLFRPITLSIRLFGNIFGDHKVLETFSGLVPLLVPVAFMMLGLIVSFIQAFVFALLSMIYISFAVSHEH